MQAKQTTYVVGKEYNEKNVELLPCVIPFKPQTKNYDLTWKYFRKIPKANPKHTHNTTNATMKKWGAFTPINPHLNLRPKNMIWPGANSQESEVQPQTHPPTLQTP